MKKKFLTLSVSIVSSILFLFSQPAVLAPTPTHAASDVVAVFSDHYTTTLKLEPQTWGGSAVVLTTFAAPNDNDNVLMSSGSTNAIYTSHWTAQKKGYVHFDVYSVSGGLFKMLLGTSYSNIYTSLTNYPWPTLKANTWTSIDVPIVDYVKAGLDDAVNVQGIKFSGTGVYFVDNIYAWGDKEVYIDSVNIPVAPTPKHEASVVKSVFSESYTASTKGVLPQTFGGTVAKLMPYKGAPGQNVLRLQNLGTSLSTIDTWKISDRDYIHVDVYWLHTDGEKYTGTFTFGMNAGDWSGNNIKSLTNFNWPVTAANQWVGLDIPVSKFKEAGLNLDQISQIKFAGSGNFYIDNLYAFKGALDTIAHPTNVPTIEVDTSYYQIKSIFCEELETPDYQVLNGITDKDENGLYLNYGQNANQEAKFVEIESGSNNKSIYLTNWNDYAFKIHKTNESIDLSEMNYLHLSVYQTGALNDNYAPVGITFWMQDKNNKTVASNVPFVQIKPGEWTSVSIPLCYYKDSLDISNVSVLRLRLDGYDSMAGYVDNIFAYRGNSFGTVALQCGDTIASKDPIADKSAGTLPPRDQTYLGVNLSSASGGTIPGVMGTNYAMPKFEDLWYFKAKGVRFIRFPFRWQRLQSTVNSPLNATEIAAMKAVVAEAERLGIWVMLDMHDYCYRTENNRYYEIGSAKHKEKTTLGTWSDWITDPAPELTAEHFADGWKRIAAEFKDFKNIWGYDLMNEPVSIDINTLKNNYQTAINAIREVDTNAYIVVEGKNYAGSQGWATSSDLLKQLVDPTGKDIIFQAHCYFDDNNSGTYLHSWANLYSTTLYKTRLDPWVKWLRDNNKRGLLGEFGVPYLGAPNSDPGYMEIIENVVKYLKENQITSTYWCGGTFYETNALTIQPDKDYYTEKSTMAVMEKYFSTFHIKTGIEDVMLANDKVSVYPNPVVNELVIESETGINSIVVLNLLGQTIFEQTKSGFDNRIQIDFSKFAQGNYLLRVKLQDGSYSLKKIVK